MPNLEAIGPQVNAQPLNRNFANNCGYGVSATGTDAYAINLNPPITAYKAGQRFRFKADVANSGACSLNVDSKGAKSIKMEDGSDPPDGFIPAGAVVTVDYDGTYMRIPNSGMMKVYSEFIAHQAETVQNNVHGLAQYGLGTDTQPLTDVNNMPGSGGTGFYRVDSSTLNTPVPGDSAGTLIHIGRAARPTQLFIDYGDGEMFFRNYISSGWQAWKKVWTNANLIYEEGTWTPELRFGGAATGITYTTQQGRYRRIGNLVHWEMRFILSSKGTATGNATIGGLPFPTVSAGPYRASAVAEHSGITLPTNGINLHLRALGTVSAFEVLASGNGISVTALNNTHFDNNVLIITEGAYHI